MGCSIHDYGLQYFGQNDSQNKRKKMNEPWGLEKETKLTLKSPSEEWSIKYLLLLLLLLLSLLRGISTRNGLLFLFLHRNTTSTVMATSLVCLSSADMMAVAYYLTGEEYYLLQ